MRSALLTVMALLIVVMGERALASGPPVAASAQPANATASKAPPPASAKSPAAHQETLEEIVARVRRRLAMEAPPRRRSTAAPQVPRPAPVPRVTLVWRPSVVWPVELAGSESPTPVPVVDPNRPTVVSESH